MKTRLIIINIIQFILGLSILFFIYWIINVSVSKTYETDNDCISRITGEDLCALQHRIEGCLIAVVLISIGLMVYRRRVEKISTSKKIIEKTFI
jgi:hypothetical protein